MDFTAGFYDGILTAIDYIVNNVLLSAFYYVMNNDMLRFVVLLPVFAFIAYECIELVFWLFEWDMEPSVKSNEWAAERYVVNKKKVVQQQIRVAELEVEKRKRLIREVKRDNEKRMKEFTRARSEAEGRSLAEEYFENNSMAMSISVNGKKFYNDAYGEWQTVNWGRIRKDGFYKQGLLKKQMEKESGSTESLDA